MKQCFPDLSVVWEGGKYYNFIANLLSVSSTFQTHAFNVVLLATVQLRVAGSNKVSE